MNTPTLKTERLILRKFTENDVAALYKMYSDREGFTSNTESVPPCTLLKRMYKSL